MREVASQSHVKLYRDYQQWLRSKDTELGNITLQVNQKIEV